MAEPNPKNTPDLEGNCPNPAGGPEHAAAFYGQFAHRNVNADAAREAAAQAKAEASSAEPV